MGAFVLVGSQRWWKRQGLRVYGWIARSIRNSMHKRVWGIDNIKISERQRDETLRLN